MNPLTGYRVAVTSAHRAEELCTLLRRHGATVCAASAITMINLPDDTELHRNTAALIACPPDIVVATTAIGFRGWIAAADGWGLAGDLLTALSGARILARGPKATGALRAAGLSEQWSPKSESSRETLDYLLASDIDDRRVAVQLHGTTDIDPIPELLDELRNAGANVIPIRVYRWHATPRGGEFDQLVTQIAQRQFDAVTFTSAAAVIATLTRAGELNILDDLLSALRVDVRAMCVGPVTASPLIRLGVPVSSPQRMRLGALARHVAAELPALRTAPVIAAGHRIELRGTCALVDGTVKPLSPAGMAILRTLVRHRGNVVDRDALLRVLPGNGSDTHAVETAVLRLRTALGDKNIVRTVVKRGYRLAISPAGSAEEIGQPQDGTA